MREGSPELSQEAVESYAPPERRSETARRLVRGLSEKINRELPGLVDDEARIRDQAYDRDLGGPFAPAVVQDARQFVRRREREFFQLEAVSPDAVEQRLQKARDAQAEHDGAIAETVIAAVLDTKLGDRYLIVRSNAYDDYAAGVDHLIVDRQTGDVVCAVDEVVADETDPRLSAKQQRAERRGEQRGSTVRFGVTFEQGRLVRRQLEHLLTFILPVSRETLRSALVELGHDEPGPAVAAVYARLTESLARQAQELQRADLSVGLRIALAKFQRALRELPSPDSSTQAIAA